MSLSALDPIATYRIEELIGQLKKDFTIAIVTHNMRSKLLTSSDFTAFMLAEEISHTVGWWNWPRQIISHQSGPSAVTEDYITGRFGPGGEKA